MTRALFCRLPTIAAVILTLSLIPQSSFAQHGGGGGGFHGGGTAFHNGGFGGGFHSGGSFHGGGFGGFNGGGFQHGFGGFPNRFGRGWGWGGWGGWNWRFGWGWRVGWGWPWWYGYPSNAYWGPYAYGCPNYAYRDYGYCNPYYSPGNSPGYVDPPSKAPGNYPQGNNSEPDWRHELGPNRQPHDVQPDESQPEPSHSPGSASSPDLQLITVKSVTGQTSDEHTLSSGISHDYFEQSHPQPVLPRARPGVRNAIILLHRIPPAARERWLASGRYSKFSPEERQLLREYAGLSGEF